MNTSRLLLKVSRVRDLTPFLSNGMSIVLGYLIKLLLVCINICTAVLCTEVTQTYSVQTHLTDLSVTISLYIYIYFLRDVEVP